MIAKHDGSCIQTVAT